MLQPFLELMLDAVDLSMTVLALLALWDDRQTGGSLLLRLLGLGSARGQGDVDRFLHELERLQSSSR